MGKSELSLLSLGQGKESHSFHSQLFLLRKGGGQNKAQDIHSTVVNPAWVRNLAVKEA